MAVLKTRANFSLKSLLRLLTSEEQAIHRTVMHLHMHACDSMHWSRRFLQDNISDDLALQIRQKYFPIRHRDLREFNFEALKTKYPAEGVKRSIDNIIEVLKVLIFLSLNFAALFSHNHRPMVQ